VLNEGKHLLRIRCAHIILIQLTDTITGQLKEKKMTHPILCPDCGEDINKTDECPETERNKTITGQKGTTMTITIGNEGRYNFHNVSDLTLRVAKENLIYARDGKTVVSVELTPSQIKRIERHFCGIADCKCGSAPRGYEEIAYNRAIIHLDN